MRKNLCKTFNFLSKPTEGSNRQSAQSINRLSWIPHSLEVRMKHCQVHIRHAPEQLSRHQYTGHWLISAVVKHFADPAHAGPVTMSNLSPVTPVEAANAITSMKSKTSPLDILSTDILKNCVDVFAVVISRLANLSFEQGIFPTAFKTAQITPLLKKPSLDPELPSSYRQSPISTPFQWYWISYSLPGSSHSSWHLRTFVECNPHTEKVIINTETALLYIFIDIFKSMDNRRGPVWQVSISVPHSTWWTTTGWYSGCRIVSDWLTLRSRGSSSTCRTESSSSRSKTTLREQLGWNWEFLKVRYNWDRSFFLHTCHLFSRSFQTRWNSISMRTTRSCTAPSPHPSSHLKLLVSRTVCVVYRTGS